MRGRKAMRMEEMQVEEGVSLEEVRAALDYGDARQEVS
jgi:hypothetical protein